MGSCCESEQPLRVENEIHASKTPNTKETKETNKSQIVNDNTQKTEYKSKPNKNEPPKEEIKKQELKAIQPKKKEQKSDISVPAAKEIYKKEEKKEEITNNINSVRSDEIKEITEIEAIDPENNYKDIYDSFNDENGYLDLRNPFQFILDLGKGSQLTSMQIQFHGRYSCTQIMIYSSFTDDIENDWIEIGSLKSDTKPKADATVNINNIINYKNRRYVKVIFSGEFYSKSRINIDRFRFYGIAGTLRKDITDKMTVIDVSGIRSNDTEKYGIQRMFTSNDREYYETPTDEYHWMILDTHGYNMSKINIEFYSSTYMPESIEFYQGTDLKNEFQIIKEYNWQFNTKSNRKKQQITFDMNELCSLMAHSRLIKMKFLVSEPKSINITFLKIYGELGENGEQKDVEFKYDWQEMQDEAENKFDEDENAKDVTQSHLIKIMETYPKTEDKNVRKFKDMYRAEPNYYWSQRLDNDKKDIWLKFDMGPINIDSFDISFTEHYHARTIKVYTCKTNSSVDNEWSLIKIKRNIQEKETKKFYLKSNHARYLKLAIADREKGYAGINRLKWNGFEPVIEDEITNKIKIYQCSGKTDACESVLKNNQDAWKSNAGETSWIIFDCFRYEVDRLSITFAEKSKPEIVKFRMSDVAPAYAFKIPSIMKWKLNTSVSWEDEEWQNIGLLEELSLVGNEYDTVGFKRFVQLEFSQFQINEMSIIKIQFFGSLSQRIADEDEQFDSVLDADSNDEKKQADGAPYKPEFVDSSPSMQGYTLENIWKKEDHFFWMSQYGIPPFLILDLGNNEKNIKEILIKSYQYYPYKTLKVSTSDKAKAKDWTQLFEDNEMESKMQTGGKYELTKYDVKKYIKMEFEELKLNMFAMASIKLYGDSEFCDKEEKIISIDDIKNMKHIDEDLIHKYREQEQKIITGQMATFSQQIQAIEQDKTKGKLCDEWVKLKTDYYMEQAKFYYIFTEMFSYQMATIYEQEQMMKIMQIQKKIANEGIIEILGFEIEHAKKDKLEEEQEKKAKEVWENAVKDKDFDSVKTSKLQSEYQTLVKQRQGANSRYNTEFSKHFTELSTKCYEMYSNEKDAKVYECWREAIDNNPRQISTLYNVQEYQQMLQYARKKDPDGLKKCWGVLAELFDKSFEQETELLHKFFVFQLSANYWEARNKSYGRPPVTILFDCGDDITQKINRLEFKIPKPCNINRIVVSTADELREEKMDSAEADDDETQFDWNNFNIIGQLILNDKLKTEKKENGLDYDDSKIVLNYRNERYVRLAFSDWDDGYTDLQIERMKFFVKDDSDLKDEDEKDKGFQIPKYKLKLIQDNKTTNRSDWHGIVDAYKIERNSYYATSDKIKTPFLIFDCETRKVDKFEIRFASTSWRQFDTITVLTTDNYNINTTDNDTKEDKWETIFEEQGQFKSYSDGENFKTVQLDCKNKRYLKLSFILSEKSSNLNITHLKWYTIDPPEYKWDIDENIKNLTYKIKIISATKCSSGLVAENVLKDNNGRKYRSIGYGINHKESIEDRIRDKVCYGLNLLRKNRGGKIDNKYKHYIKFLLCFQNERNYAEMLYSSKLVMNILRKPLDIEYNRLQSINSKILTLNVEEKDQCSDIKSMHPLLEWDYNKWYQQRKAMFWPDDLKPLAEKWTKLGLKLTDPEFKQIRRKGMLEVEKSFCSAEDLAMEYINLIANKLDPSFQKSMKDLFKQNRNKLNLKYPTGNRDLGVQSGPVKTKARQKIKIILKYFNKPPPQCMSVLDIVRCAIVCEDDTELCSLFELIMNEFSGSVMRVKNAFDDIKKGEDSHGYRAVMINIAFNDENVLPNGYKFVCEAQLLLNKYYQVRKNMHLGYGICRSEDGGISQNKKPHYVLAQDSCKFGKLDI